MKGLKGKRQRKGVRLAALLLTLIMCLPAALPVCASETDDYYIAEKVCISMGNPGSKDGKIPDSMKELVSDDKIIDAFPQGVSYDAEEAVLTLNNFQDSDCRLDLNQMVEDEDDYVLTLNLIGDNKLLDIQADMYGEGRGWLLITGTGTLTVSSIQTEYLIVESGIINVVQQPDYFDYAGNFFNYAVFNFNFGDEENDLYLSSYRFLGGEFNVDCTSDLGGSARRVGMDVQSGNVEIRNAKVRIDLGNNDWLGLGVGWTGRKQNGGKLIIENGTLEIISADYQAYFYNLISEGDPLHYIVGKDGPEKEVTFKEAFEEQPFTDDITRYARVTDGKGYLMISSREEDMPVFLDVPEGAYFADAVKWAVDKGITNGTGMRQFNPNGTCTRGQVVTFLWRANGSPEPKTSENPFTDNKSGQYYYKAVLWAVENGITTGTSGTTFSPDAGCTRGQVATFLYRAQEMPAVGDADNPFEDVQANAYYYNAVLWAVKNNITKGISPTQFRPDSTCTRGQIVTFLYRAMA